MSDNESDKCDICLLSLRDFTPNAIRGYGDGSGDCFAHEACYWRKKAQGWYEAKLEADKRYAEALAKVRELRANIDRHVCDRGPLAPVRDDREPCPKCQGRGYVRDTFRHLDAPCEKCDGSGWASVRDDREEDAENM